MAAFVFLVFCVFFSSTVRGQECDKPTDMEIEDLVIDSLRDVNGDGDVSADITITQLNSTLVCLASASTENKYQFVSVVAQYTRMDGSDPQFDQTGQFEFECASGSAWRITGNELGSDSRENRNVSVDASRFSTTERTDCFWCIKPGHTQLGLLVGPSPVPDSVHHCLACSGCNDPQLCSLPDGTGFPAVGVCCNAYEGGVCAPECSTGTVLVANDRECVTECPTGLYNVNGVCENCAISCENGGTLVSDPNTCECQCGTIYGGSDCSECRCQNGGTCGSSDSGQCYCTDDYSGMFCETCSKQCQNGGTLNTDECSCACVEGFAGDNCGTECSSVTENCKECSGSPITCAACEDGYNITPEGTCACDPSCQNGGTQDASSCECSCPVGFSGSYCEDQDCPSLTDNCKECSGAPLTCTVCEDGYTITPEGTCACDPSCQNGGTQDASSCDCSCPAGFSGIYCGDKDCSSVTDNCKECSGTPLMCTMCEDGYTIAPEGTCACDQSCQNGGTQDASSCECSCPAGFSGIYCGDKDCSNVTDNCKECSGTPLMCTVCEEEYTLNEKTGMCECVPNCDECGSDNKCIQCKEGYKLDNGACIELEDSDSLPLDALIGAIVGGIIGFILLLALATCIVVGLYHVYHKQKMKNAKPVNPFQENTTVNNPTYFGVKELEAIEVETGVEETDDEKLVAMIEGR